ncbi:DUF736 domain-containing protein [Candidatus Micrarchaeota archaeon]|jgi:uncharacterized protein (DUF736 family)|nr:DUF736 domain-containing protein [Candidatus Micrarchaeota archaeon]
MKKNNISDFESDDSQKKGSKPDFRIVQTDRDQEGETKFKNVGAMWKNTSKTGNEFYTLKIGELRLLVFKNE